MNLPGRACNGRSVIELAVTMLRACRPCSYIFSVALRTHLLARQQGLRRAADAVLRHSFSTLFPFQAQKGFVSVAIREYVVRARLFEKCDALRLGSVVCDLDLSMYIGACRIRGS